MILFSNDIFDTSERKGIREEKRGNSSTRQNAIQKGTLGVSWVRARRNDSLTETVANNKNGDRRTQLKI